MPELLEVRGLRKVFRGRRGHDDVVAVEGASFDLSAGESLAIVGESGSGKSTIARLLVGLETSTDGTISVLGRPRGAKSPRTRERRVRAREVQIVFQDPYSSLDRLEPVGHVLESALGLNPSVSPASRRERAVELLEAVGLQARHAEVLPRALSGGQRQRVAIARAIAVEPRILILDEAVSALDVSIQAQILNLLADIRERSDIAYLFISHDLAVVNQISDRCLVMESGRVVEQGRTRDVLSSPRQPYTRALRDAVPRPGWQPSRSPNLD